MKNYLIVGLICIIAALAIGFEPLLRTINDATRQGTLRGVEVCIDYSSSDLLADDAVIATCVATFQRRLYGNDYATGRAGPEIDRRRVSWEGTLQNKTSDHVTTWVKISVSLYNAEGDEQEVFAETPIWIDPLGEADFSVELSDIEREQFDDVEFCDYDDTEPKGCVTWGVTAVMGLSI
ncbi:MAG: hypothetical protein ABJL99_23105 [Aliishimia sp.]